MACFPFPGPDIMDRVNPFVHQTEGHRSFRRQAGASRRSPRTRRESDSPAICADIAYCIPPPSVRPAPVPATRSRTPPASGYRRATCHGTTPRILSATGSPAVDVSAAWPRWPATTSASPGPASFPGGRAPHRPGHLPTAGSQPTVPMAASKAEPPTGTGFSGRTPNSSNQRPAHAAEAPQPRRFRHASQRHRKPLRNAGAIPIDRPDPVQRVGILARHPGGGRIRTIPCQSGAARVGPT